MTHFLLKNINLEESYIGPAHYPTGTQTKNYTIEIKDGKVQQFYSQDDTLPNLSSVDGEGSLVLPTLKEMHCHLDKSKLGAPWVPVTPTKSLLRNVSQVKLRS